LTTTASSGAAGTTGSGQTSGLLSGLLGGLTKK
jgi:hypothetical protein